MKALDQISFSFAFKIPIRDPALAVIQAVMGRDLDVNIDHARLLEVSGLLVVGYLDQEFCCFQFRSLLRLADKAFKILVD